ncbi:MAG: glycosyltransferase [Methanothrix sp.]|nr:glycosyltransferase [Methanothrix sp.]
MSRSPLVSIITPTYNHERFIAECIESVLSQTYPHWEQIVVDDGSSDRTADVVSRYDDERIALLRQPNRGIWHLAETYNSALSRSSGEFVAVLEGDDFWPPSKLEHQIRAMASSSAVLSWGTGALTNSSGQITSYRPQDIRPYLGISRYGMLRELLFHNPITACTVVCRREALDSIGGFRQPECSPYLDRPTWLELGLIGDFLAMDEVLGYYRMHDRQVTATMRPSMFKAGRQTADFFLQLPESVRRAIAGEGSDPVRIDSRLAEGYYYYGRACLVERRWAEAEDGFLKAIASCSIGTKAKAAAGLICGRFRTDLEWIAEILGEARIDDER